MFLMLSTTSAAPAPAPTTITADLGALMLAKLAILKGNLLKINYLQILLNLSQAIKLLALLQPGKGEKICSYRWFTGFCQAKPSPSSSSAGWL